LILEILCAWRSVRIASILTHAAALAGISRQCCQRLLRRHGIDRHRFAG
jgi:hypothetical protein